ncbi:MAG: hypothetical protein IPP72_03235 [Chitinophagaceae bacterium]|nr:hypothetical protein [Chitinophagaceae bacterium]
MVKFNRFFFITVLIGLISSTPLYAQVIENVKFGKNRVQYKKFKWQYYQSRNFNTFFNQNGQELAKFVLQVAEEELPSIEEFTEYSLQRRANIVVYNEYADMQQSNIGMDIEWQNTGGTTKFVNNKMVVYFNGDHAQLRRQIRQGIARIITDNLLFGEDLGEFAGNQALLDLPNWLTDGYVDFAAENWSTKLDDELKSEMLSGKYTKFYKFAFQNPRLAGHAFWYYIEEKYKKENVTYFLYLARIYKNLNRASMQVCKMKFKDLLAEFMLYEEDKYETDIRKRRAYPKGQAIESFEVDQRHDYYRINVNPNKKNSSYVLVEFKKGFVKVKLYDDFDEYTILKYGIRSYRNEVNPDYPLLAWDPKGTRITVIYNQEGRLKLFVYDLVTRIKYPKLDLTDQFQQVQDVKYMLDSRNLLLSATKNAHSDIFTINLENEKVQQITNDVYADLDPSFVSFPGKTGIIFSSNRPSAEARGGDTSIPSHNRYNIFFVSNASAKAELNQITQLSNLKYGNAKLPMPYNSNHFTFVSDENGVANRYAGFFTSKAAGVDTLVLIGDDILRNPSPKDVDSVLKVYKKDDVDSIAVVTVSQDSAYTFPLTNYESNLAETRVAGDNQQVSEVTRQSDDKTLYKLKIDENTLRRRNITVPPTTYMKRVIMADKIVQEAADKFDKPLPGDSTKSDGDIFQNEFEEQKKDSSSKFGTTVITVEAAKYDALKNAKLYPYKPVKFGADYGGVSFSNSILFNRYQAYAGGSGPIMLGSSTPLNGLVRLGTSELMEDVRIFGGFRLSTNLNDNEWLFGYENYKRRVDWGLTYYRNAEEVGFDLGDGQGHPGKIFTNIYMANVSYPFDRTKRISLSFGIRNENNVLFTDINFDPSLKIPNLQRRFAVTHAEYVYDNTLNPTQNIWNGLRYKVFFDWNTDISKEKNSTGKYNFNWGFDARYYYPIYRNFIWAGRASGDFSWGSQKTIYYVGGADGWLMFGGNGGNRYFNSNNRPAADVEYAFQSLVGNLRGFTQNVANGNNAITINSEFRLPVWTTFFNRPINNAFVRNFQLVQFIDLGNAWNGAYKGISRPSTIYGNPPVQVQTKVGGIGPLAGGYGFGVRSVLLGYFLKFDAAWEMNGIFKGKPIYYFSMGLDF